jgi:phosphoribosylglycinamide formyltransferase-1
MSQARIAIFASGNGSNAEAIIHHFKDHPGIEVCLVLSNNAEAYALVRAESHGITTKTFDRTTFRETTKVLEWLAAAHATHIVLAGFLWLVPAYIIEQYPGRIINIHPSLLPKHGGKGMYGIKVHEAVKESGDAISGITIHLVDTRYDEGRVVFQVTCPVAATDRPEDIAAKIHQLEYQHFPQEIEKWILNG